LTLVREALSRFRSDAGRRSNRGPWCNGITRDVYASGCRGAGLWLSREKQRRTFHQPRLRREETYMASWLRIDGSSITGSKIAGAVLSRQVFVDDATGKLMQLRFIIARKARSAISRALDLYLQDHGAPIAFYSMKHTVFSRCHPGCQTRPKGHHARFGLSTLCELNIEFSSQIRGQAKGSRQA